MSRSTLHSSVNYKDGLAITGKGPIIRRWPLVPGIDLAGTVRSSSHPQWKAGDKVVLGGWGVGEGHYGGFAEMARVNGDWLVPLPDGFSTADAMAVGVAGYTAMLCVMALEEQGVTRRRAKCWSWVQWRGRINRNRHPVEARIQRRRCHRAAGKRRFSNLLEPRRSSTARSCRVR